MMTAAWTKLRTAIYMQTFAYMRLEGRENLDIFWALELRESLLGEVLADDVWAL